MQTVREIFFNFSALAALLGGGVLVALAFGLSRARGKRWLWILLVLALALHLVVFLDATLSYVFYPYEGKSVVEGVLLHNSIRYMHGEQPYHAPGDLPAVSLNYPPFHDMALALFMGVTGEPSLLAGRLFSLLLALGTALVAGLAVWRRARDLPAAALGGLLVITFYGVTGHWIEQVRNDALLGFLLALGFLLTDRAMARDRLPIGGLVAFFLAVFTKQVALFAPVAVVICLWRRAPRQAAIWGGAFLAAAVVAFVAMDVWSGGWFSFYVLKVPFAVGTDWSKYDLAVTFFGSSFILLWGIVAAWIAARSEGGESRPDASLGMFLLGLGLFACLAQSFKWGAALNAFAPVVPVVAVMGGLAFHDLMRRAREAEWLQIAILSLLLAQVAMLTYQPVLPTVKDYDAQRRIAQWVRAAPGEKPLVFVSVFSSQVYLNGKRYFGDDVQLGDLERAGYWNGGELLEKVRRREFILLILRIRMKPNGQPEIEPEALAQAVRENYLPAEFLSMRSPMCKWDMEAYVPKDAAWRPAP